MTLLSASSPVVNDERCWHCGVVGRPGAWTKWRYHNRHHWLPWGYGWLCSRCQRSPEPWIDGDGKPLGYQLHFLTRKPAARLLRSSELSE